MFGIAGLGLEQWFLGQSLLPFVFVFVFVFVFASMFVLPFVFLLMTRCDLELRHDWELPSD